MNERRVTAEVEIDRIKRYRKGNRISQQTLADMCGLHRTYISDLENAKCNPTLGVLLTLARSLDVELSDLLDFDSRK